MGSKEGGYWLAIYVFTKESGAVLDGGESEDGIGGERGRGSLQMQRRNGRSSRKVFTGRKGAVLLRRRSWWEVQQKTSCCSTHPSRVFVGLEARKKTKNAIISSSS